MGCIVYQTNKKTGVVYAYWNESYRDKTTKKPTAHRTYLGRVDPETKEIIKKAESGKRNRSPVSQPVPKEESNLQSSSKNDTELEQKLQAANETISRLQQRIEEMESLLEQIGKLAAYSNNI